MASTEQKTKLIKAYAQTKMDIFEFTKLHKIEVEEFRKWIKERAEQITQEKAEAEAEKQKAKQPISEFIEINVEYLINELEKSAEIQEEDYKTLTAEIKKGVQEECKKMREVLLPTPETTETKETETKSEEKIVIETKDGLRIELPITISEEKIAKIIKMVREK